MSLVLHYLVLLRVQQTSEIWLFDWGFHTVILKWYDIHQEVLKVQDDVAKIVYSDDQTGMVIPENYLLIQSMLFKRDRTEAMKRADKLFQMTPQKRKNSKMSLSSFLTISSLVLIDKEYGLRGVTHKKQIRLIE